jgi:hypothetical protein
VHIQEVALAWCLLLRTLGGKMFDMANSTGQQMPKNSSSYRPCQSDGLFLFLGGFVNLLLAIKIKPKSLIQLLLAGCIFLSTDIYAAELSESELELCQAKADELFYPLFPLTPEEQVESCVCVKNKHPDLPQTKKDWDTLGPESLALTLLECSETKLNISYRKKHSNYPEEFAKMGYSSQDIERLEECFFRGTYNVVRKVIINKVNTNGPNYMRETFSCR